MRVERVVAIAVIACACSGGASKDPMRDKLELALSDDNDVEVIRQRVADRERGFLEALSKPDASAAEFIDMSVQFIDAATPAEAAKLSTTRYRTSGGYFAALNLPPRADHSRDRIEVRVERKNYAVATATPEQGRPIVTTWLPFKDEWRIVVLEVNVPDSYIERIRKINEDQH